MWRGLIGSSPSVFGNLKFSWIWAYNPIQEVLAEPGWRVRMTVDDWRALSPLIYHHVNPYGRIELDMSRRLAFAA